MMTRKELWENREQVLRNTRRLLERVKGKKSKFKEQTRKVMKESSQKGLGIDTEELKKVYWVIQNKYLPMLKKVGELQKDMEFLDSFQFGKWDIPQVELNKTKTEGKKRRTLKEETIDRFRQEDVQVKNWKEGSSHPTSKVIGSPLQFTEYSLPYVLNNTGTQTFYDFVERKHPSDFVWGWKDRNQTVVMVMKNPSQRGLEINGVSKKKVVVSEEVKDKLGDDYKEVRPQPITSWKKYRPYKQKSRQYRPDTLSLLWRYESTESAKQEKEEELRKKYPNKELTWMNVPHLTWVQIEGTNGVSNKKNPITEKETQETTRVEKFKPQPDDVVKNVQYPPGPLGRYRGISDHRDQYIWNELGTESAKVELLDRVKKMGRSKLGTGGIVYDNYWIGELRDEGKTIVYNSWTDDSSD